MFKKLLPLLPALLLAGCATPVITRLTPNQQLHNSNNLYPVEVALDSSQEALRWDSVQAYVVVNGRALPMRPVALVQHRWEGLVPMPDGASSVSYRFKFDFFYNSFGAPKHDSVMSRIYTLRVASE